MGGQVGPPSPMGWGAKARMRSPLKKTPHTVHIWMKQAVLSCGNMHIRHLSPTNASANDTLSK